MPTATSAMEILLEARAKLLDDTTAKIFDDYAVIEALLRFFLSSFCDAEHVREQVQMECMGRDETEELFHKAAFSLYSIDSAISAIAAAAAAANK